MRFNPQMAALNLLHVCNDGFQASLLLLLPFVAKDLHINLFDVGVLGTGLGLMSLLVAMPASFVSVARGGMKTLIFLLFFYAVGYIGPAFFPYYIWILIFFIVASVGFGSFHPIAFALVSKISDPIKRGKNTGDFAAWGDIGRIGVAGCSTFLIAQFGWRLTALGFGLLAAGIGIMLSLFFRKTSFNAPAQTAKQKNSVFGFGDILQNKLFVSSTLAATLDSFASDSLFVFLPFLLLSKGIGLALLGPCTAAFFVGNLFGKSVLGRLVDRLPNSTVFIAAQLGMALCIALLTYTSSIFWILTISVILGALTKGTVPVTVTMLAESLPHDGNFEKAYGVNAMAVAVAITTAPLVFGFISNRYNINYAFYTSATIALLAVLPALFYKKVKKEAVVAPLGAKQ